MQHTETALLNTSAVTNQIEHSGFATPREAAEFLRLSKAMIHKLIGEGEMPACRYGRAVRIPWTWLRAQAGTGK
jgi:excisionase family DNA binding protein